jgi:hypothetical protein
MEDEGNRNPQEDQIRQLKEMLAQNQQLAEQMRSLIVDLEKKTADSKQKKRKKE